MKQEKTPKSPGTFAPLSNLWNIIQNLENKSSFRDSELWISSPKNPRLKVASNPNPLCSPLFVCTMWSHSSDCYRMIDYINGNFILWICIFTYVLICLKSNHHFFFSFGCLIWFQRLFERVNEKWTMLREVIFMFLCLI